MLVTGGTGFIGRHLVRRLIECGNRVCCLVRTTSAIGEVRALGAELMTRELADAGGMVAAIAESRPEIVYHVAGLVRASRRAEFAHVNVNGTAVIAAACAACPTPPVLVVVSSLAAAGPSRLEAPRVEEDAPGPVSAYGRSKLAGERAAAAHADRVPVTIVRPPIVFGEGDRGVRQMLRPIAKWGVHPISRRDFRLSLIHVADLVDGLLLAAARGERVDPHEFDYGGGGRGVYFMATDEHPTYAELGTIMARALGKDGVRRVRVPAAMLRLAGSCGDALARFRGRGAWLNSDKVAEALAGSWTCSSAKAREQLEWTPAATLGDRLRQTVKWYRESGWL